MKRLHELFSAWAQRRAKSLELLELTVNFEMKISLPYILQMENLRPGMMNHFAVKGWLGSNCVQDLNPCLQALNSALFPMLLP